MSQLPPPGARANYRKRPGAFGAMAGWVAALALATPVAAAPAAAAANAPLARYETGIMMLTVTGIFVLAGILFRQLSRFRPFRRMLWLMPILIGICAAAWGALGLAGTEQLANLKALLGFLLAFFLFLALLYPVTRLLLPSRALRTRAGVPTLLRGLAVAILGFIGLFVLLSWMFPDLSFTPVFVTSGVVSLVFGLALQDLLANLMAGVMLSVERPFTVGDWVRIGDTEGEVVELTWRVTKVRTRENDFVLIPNSMTAKQNVTNFALPTSEHLLKLEVAVGYATPCSLAVQALVEAALNVEEVLRRPAPDAFLQTFGESGIEYELRVWIDNYESVNAIASEVRKQVWYAFKRYGISIPFPQRDVNLRQAPAAPTVPVARLVATAGPLRGAVFPLRAEPVVIGRHPDCTVAVTDAHVSAQHAVVEPHADGYRLRDLGSRHGTRLNGAPVAEARLEPGDRIDIEPVTLIFEVALVPAGTQTAERSTPASLPKDADLEPSADPAPLPPKRNQYPTA